MTCEQNEYWTPPIGGGQSNWQNLASWNNEVILEKFYNCNKQFLKENKYCVYMIGDFYIGVTKNLRNRLLNHFRGALRGDHANKRLLKMIVDTVNNGGTADVKAISNIATFEEEGRCILKYRSLGYPLTNQVVNPYSSSNCQYQRLIDKYKMLCIDEIPLEMVVKDIKALRALSNKIDSLNPINR